MPMSRQADTFIFIPGGTRPQGTTPNEGKFTSAYGEGTSTLLMSPQDMNRWRKNGDRVSLRTWQGQFELLW